MRGKSSAGYLLTVRKWKNTDTASSFPLWAKQSIKSSTN